MVRASRPTQLDRRFPFSHEVGVLSIGILLVEMPRMLHDVVRNIIDAEPDLSVVAERVAVGAVADCVERERPDVVVLLAKSGSPPEMCEELLSRFPELAVVALENGGLRGSIYMLRPTRFRVAEISRTELVTAIRRAARPLRFLAALYAEAGNGDGNDARTDNVPR
jgi:DNA-binding NarL/FixJ family response regulator